MTRFFTLLLLNFFDFFYKKKIINFIKKKKFDNFNIVFDVGAHKGESLELYLKNFKINEIYSFEPSHYSFNYLRRKVSKNNKKKLKTKIIIENFALGEHSKKIKIKQMNESSSSTIKELNIDSSYFKKKKKLLFNLEKENLYNEILVEQKSIDEYMHQKKIKKLDFLKIDTEGYEFEILLGAKKNINNINLVLFEHHYDDMIKKNYKFSDVHDFLNKNNFNQIFKAKMPFRKTFEYIYKNKTY